MNIFNRDFFKDILQGSEQDIYSSEDIFGKKKTETAEPKATKALDKAFEMLDKKYDKSYYNTLNENERKLHEGKKIDTTSLASERFVKNNDLGKKTPEGWTGLMTKNQLKDAGYSIKDKDISTRDIPSTAIGRVRYNPKTGNLYITFKNGKGKEYLFPNVPEDKVRKLLNAGSKGRYYGKYVKPHYAVSKEEALAIKARDRNN